MATIYSPSSNDGGVDMADRLRGKVALITGAGSGIGAATAGLFAREGAAVTLADLAREGLEPVAAVASSAGSPALVTTGDVTKRVDTERLRQETLERVRSRAGPLHNGGGS